MSKGTKHRMLLGSALALAMTSASPAQEVFKLGAINPYAGPMALYGDEVTRGYELAADAINARGGILGRKIAIVRGSASNPQEGIAAVEQLAGRDKVDAFIGTYVSSVSAAASEAALGHGKLYWDTNAAATSLTERKLPNFVRAGPNSGHFAQQSVAVTTDLLAGTLGKQPKDLKVWLEHEDSIYGASVAKIQKELLEKAGVQVVGVGAHSARAIDFTDSILRAKTAGPDVWITTGYVADTNLLLRTAREQGFRPGAMMTVGTGDTKETLEAVGADRINGVLVVSYARPDVAEAFGPGAAAYLKAYRDKYMQDPIAPQSLTAFVGLKIMADTINAAGSAAPDAVSAALAKIDKPFGSYETGFGAKFDDQKQNERALMTVVQWQDGKVGTVFPVAAAGSRKLIPLNR